MDPISIISLVGTCASLATRVFTTAGQIDEFLQSYREADRSVASLSTTLRVFGESLTQMRSWLGQEPAVSQNLRRTIKGSVDDCEVVLDDLEEHVSSVLRSTKAGNRGSTLGSLGFGRKLKHLWNANTIAKHETRLHSQVQTVMHLINFVKLNNTDQQDSAVGTAETRTIVARSAGEANIIRGLRGGSAIHENKTVYTNVGDHDKELEVDEELIRSPAYIAQYRALMRGGPSSSKSSPTFNSSKPLDREGGYIRGSSLAVLEQSSRRPGTSVLKSLTWSLSPESRNLVNLLCQASIAGNIKWIENLLDEGVYLDGCATEDDEKYAPLKPKRNLKHGGRTPLMLAAMHKRNEAFQLLLDRGAYLDTKDSKGRSVWHYLVEYNPDLCIQLAEGNINPPMGGSLSSLLCEAIDIARVDVLESLLKRATRHHANAACKIWSGIPCKMEDGIPSSTVDATILWKTMEKKNIDMVKLLIDKGASIDKRIQFLRIERGAQGWDLGNRTLNLLAGTSNPGPTPLISLVGDTSRLDLVKYLISKGASITTKTECRIEPLDDWGERHDVTPLHLARGPCAEFLVTRGAKVFAMDSQGQTPLFWAIGFWAELDTEAALANLAQGSPASIVDKKGFSPLLLLAQRLSNMEWISENTLDNYKTIADALVDAGAGQTAIWDGHGDSIYRRLMMKRKYVDDSCPVGWIYDSRNKTKIKAISLGTLHVDGTIGAVSRGDVMVHRDCVLDGRALNVDEARSITSSFTDLYSLLLLSGMQKPA